MIAPIVPGTKRKRYVYRGLSSPMRRASVAASAIPERLSLQSEGWQQWHETRTSSAVAPGTRCSAYVSAPSPSEESTSTSYSPGGSRSTCSWLTQKPQLSL